MAAGSTGAGRRTAKSGDVARASGVNGERTESANLIGRRCCNTFDNIRPIAKTSRRRRRRRPMNELLDDDDDDDCRDFAFS